MSEVLTVVHVGDAHPEIATRVDDAAVSVYPAARRDQALTRVESDAVDCVVCEHPLPGVDALDFLDDVAARAPDVPRVLVTADGSESLASAALSAGIDEYVSLDGDPEAAAGAVADVIRDRTRPTRPPAGSTYRQLVEQNIAGVYEVRDGVFTYVNPEFADIFGYEPSELVGESPETVIAADDVEDIRRWVQRLYAGQAEDFKTEHRGVTKGGEEVIVRIHARLLGTDDDPVVLGFARDVTDRRRREERLTALNDVLAAFVSAEDQRTACERLIEAAADGLHLPVTAVALVDEEHGGLRTVAATDRADHASLEPARDGAAWDAFASGEPTVLDAPDGVEAPRVAVCPLGRYGVLVAGVAESDVDFVRTVAGNLRGALDRIDREAALQRRERRLGEQNRRLDRLNRSNEIIRSVDQALVGATSRPGIERAVCEELTREDGYAFAWIGEFDRSAGRVEPRESAGGGRGYLESIAGTADGGDPAARAAASGSVTVVDEVRGDPPYEPWREAALQRGYRSVIALPLRYRDSVYGVLTVYGDAPGAFDELERGILGDLAETIAYAINAAESRKALVSDEVVELEVRLDAGAFPLLEHVQADPDREFALDGIVPAGDGFRVFYSVTGADPSTIAERTGRSVATAETEVVATRGEECLVESVVTEDSIVFWLLDRGGVPRAVDVTEDGVRVRIELAREADVREFLTLLESEYPSADLLARRDVERPVRARAAFEDALAESLTPRQREVLRTAYLSGYFETPRHRTGSDVAAALGISQPTFSSHVRTGTRRLLDLLFADDAPDLDR